MRQYVSQVLSLLVSAVFATFAMTAVAAPTSASHQQLSNGGSHAMPTKEYCKQHPTDPRCKK
ncbi:MAG: hypothetical protein M0015_01455 [Betaproteobacteria bacterium]|nr:hypothetical protein [Betaproteobacteria bacterium]